MKKETGAKISYDYKSDKYTFTLSAPLSVCWQITTKCNLSCKYCISNSGPFQKKGLSTEKALKIIRELGRIGVGRLDFTGGEPLIREDLEILLKESKKLKINTLVTTNTLLLDAKKIKMLKKYSTIIQVSIDGKEKTHNEQRQMDVYKKTIENIKKLIKAGCKVRLNSFIYKSNLKEINYLLKLSKNLGVYSHLFILFSAQGRGAKHLDQIVSKENTKKLKDKIRRYGEKHNFYIRLYDYDEYPHSCVLITPYADIISQAAHEKDCIKVGNMLKTPLEKLFASKDFDHFVHMSHYLQKRIQ